MTVAVLLTAPSVAVTTADVLAVAPVAVAVSVTDVAPAGTVTEPGTGSTLELLASATDVPPAGAGELSVTVSVTACPLWMDPGEAPSAARTGAFTVSTTLLLTEPCVAVSVTDVAVPTAAGVKLYVALVAPAATVTVVPAGIVVPSELDSPTVTPLGPA